MKDKSLIRLLVMAGVFVFYICFVIYFILNFSRLLHPMLLMALMQFCGANCQRRLSELYRGIYGSVVQLIFGSVSVVASVLVVGFAIGLFWVSEIKWFEPFMLFAAAITIPVFDEIYMFVTCHERNWIAMFAVQIASSIGIAITAIFMIRFFMN